MRDVDKKKYYVIIWIYKRGIYYDCKRIDKEN